VVGVLVRLKWKLLLVGGRRGGPASHLAVWVAFLMAAVAGLFALAGITSVARTASGEGLDALLVGAAALLCLGWGLGPVILTGADSSLELDRLAVFPLRRSELTLGLVLAGAVGPGGLFTVLVLTGLVTAAVSGAPSWAVLLDLAAVLVLAATCLVAGRLVSAAVAGAARRRRWRDLALVLGPLLAVSVNVVVQVGSRAAGAVGHLPPWVISVARSLRWSPPGMAAEAMVATEHGHLVLAVAWLLLAAVVLLHLAALLGLLTDRALAASTDRAVGGATRGGGLFRGALRVLPRTRRGTQLARELRLTWRDPRRRVELFTSVVPMAGILAPILSSAQPELVLVAAVPAFFVSASSINVFGFDARARWIDVAAGADPVGDVLVKMIGRAVIAAVPTLVLLGVLVTTTGSSEAVAPALALAITAFGIGILPGLNLSVVSPVPYPDDGRSPFSRGGTGQTTRQFGPAFAILLGGGAVLGAFTGLTLATHGHPAARVGMTILDAAVGLALSWWAVRRAAQRVAGREPELLLALSRR